MVFVFTQPVFEHRIYRTQGEPAYHNTTYIYMLFIKH
jgi:hypothetical protein